MNNKQLELFSEADFDEEQTPSTGEPCASESAPADPGVTEPKRNLSGLFERLAHSRFRNGFYLNQKDKAILRDKGLDTIRQHAVDIIAKRLAPAEIPNDGKQTPMRHGTSPVFIAQHATACCCRGCLEKWHHIPKGRLLTSEEQSYIVDIIMEWIKRKNE
jgi:exodeoxyribonuclease V alpha subunit